MFSDFELKLTPRVNDPAKHESATKRICLALIALSSSTTSAFEIQLDLRSGSASTGCQYPLLISSSRYP